MSSFPGVQCLDMLVCEHCHAKACTFSQIRVHVLLYHQAVARWLLGNLAHHSLSFHCCIHPGCMYAQGCLELVATVTTGVLHQCGLPITLPDRNVVLIVVDMNTSSRNRFTFCWPCVLFLMFTSMSIDE